MKRANSDKKSSYSKAYTKSSYNTPPLATSPPHAKHWGNAVSGKKGNKAGC